ncbi:uncharacterized protein LOC115035025 [Acyrthosiphon pisum]|uniref:Uncharacterized protein n=1 Tax=Acyrthosiphon pisum TaxID=7029 RepID=A0A8R2NUH8_ACYPI|nr:uncharacterized protein LOC115035025 [Acyrthosiphon pisum]
MSGSWTYCMKDDERTYSCGGLSDQDTGRPPSHPCGGSCWALTTVRGALQQAADPSQQYSWRSERRMLWCSTAVTAVAYSGDSSLHGISIRQVEDESRNPPLPEDHHTTMEMLPASVKPTRQCSFWGQAGCRPGGSD